MTTGQPMNLIIGWAVVAVVGFSLPNLYWFFIYSTGWLSRKPPHCEPIPANRLKTEPAQLSWVCLLVVEVILSTHSLLVLYIPNQPNGSQYSV